MMNEEQQEGYRSLRVVADRRHLFKTHQKPRNLKFATVDIFCLK